MVAALAEPTKPKNGFSFSNSKRTSSRNLIFLVFFYF